MTMKKIAAEVRKASTKLSTILDHGRRPRAMPITMAPNTPRPAASVTVTNPPKMPPITRRNSRSVAHTSLRLTHRSLQSVRCPRGSQSGFAQ